MERESDIAPSQATTTTTSYWSEDAWGQRLTCPITQQLFRDPVVCCDGFTYERGPIERWFASHGTSPLTREKINGVFHPMPSTRAEVDAFLASLALDKRRCWRRWSRSAAFQAAMDALQSALFATAPEPIAWRRLLHESEEEWDLWNTASCSTPAHREPKGAAVAKQGRLRGWMEEDMANVWHQLPTLAAKVDFDKSSDEMDGYMSTSGLVFRAVQRLLEYANATCAGYIMAGAAVGRSAETGAWVAATAIVRFAEDLDVNLLVRTLAASYADTPAGWRLIRDVCERAMTTTPSSSHRTMSRGSDESSNDESGSEEDDDYFSEEEFDGIDVVRADSSNSEGSNEEGSEGDDDDGMGEEEQEGEASSDSSVGQRSFPLGVELLGSASLLRAAPSILTPSGASILGRRSRATSSTLSAEEQAFQEAMSIVDRRGAGLFSTQEDDGYGSRYQGNRRRSAW